MSNKHTTKKPELITTNKKIIDFYSKNSQLDFEIMNLIFIDFLEKIMNDINGTINNVITNDILSNVKEISKEIISLKTIQTNSTSQFQNDLLNVKESVSKLNSEISNNILSKMNEIKKDYVDDLKTIINSNEKTNVLKTIEIMDKQNDILLTKTINFINEVLPKSQIQYYNQLEGIIKTFREETNKNMLEIKTNKAELNIGKIAEIFEQKQNHFITSVQQPLLNYITSSEERLTNNIKTLSEDTKININSQEKVNDELLEFLKKNNSLVSKNIGEIGEEKLYNLLTKIYPNGEIINCSNLAKHGDIILKRNHKKSILFENKQHSANVPKDEVLKFIRDCEEQNCSGLLLSQNTGISNKSNFQIDIQENNVLIYIHNCNYDEYKIQSCVSLIDHLTDILSQIKKETNKNIISDELLLEINQEFQNFLNQKETVINFIKESNKKIINQITDIELPSLHKLLSTKFASTKTLNLKCDKCNNFTGTNSKSLAAHKSKCIPNKNTEDSPSSEKSDIVKQKNKTKK